MNMRFKILKFSIIFFIIIFFIYLIKELLPIFLNLSTEEGRKIFKITIENLGLKGVFLVIGLMCSQILIPILPGEPIEILAGMCFGVMNGCFVLIIGIIISTSLIFILVRTFGKKFIYSFINKDKIDKIENSKLLKNEKKIDVILFILFLIPGTPKDFITYIGALLPIHTYKFFIITIIARIPSIISSTIVGSNITSGKWEIIILVYLMTFALCGIILFIVNKKEKNIIREVDKIK